MTSEEMGTFLENIGGTRVMTSAETESLSLGIANKLEE